VLTDPKQRVVAWQDLAVGDNTIADDAFQPVNKSRPQHVLSAIGGQPAVRFNGKASFLTTTPITTTDDQTIVVVFQYAEPASGGKRHTGQIVNYNGPPSRYLPDIYSPGVLQMGEKIDGKNGPLYSIAAKAFVGRDSRKGDISTGVVVSESLNSDSAHVAVYTYDLSKGAAKLYVDGQQVAEASAPTRVAVTSRKVIGKHGIFNQWYFRGDLSELIIFNTALDWKEAIDLSQHLMHHYGIHADVDMPEQL
jgi:concanavalin A-like lectin/glucanase superfamily protein